MLMYQFTTENMIWLNNQNAIPNLKPNTHYVPLSILDETRLQLEIMHVVLKDNDYLFFPEAKNDLPQNGVTSLLSWTLIASTVLHAILYKIIKSPHKSVHNTFCQCCKPADWRSSSPIYHLHTHSTEKYLSLTH